VKRMTRMLSLVLCLALCAALFAVSGHAAGGLTNFTARKTYSADLFTDVKPADWFAANVETVYELGLMNGKGGSKFDPNGDVTIAELITIAARLHSIYHTGSDTFPATNPWYKTYVDYADRVGILPPGDGDLNVPAIRWHVSLILANALPESELPAINQVEDNAIPDVKVTKYGADAIYKFYRAGIMTGSDTRGTFNSNSNVKRSEVAAVVSRLVDASQRKSVTLKASAADSYNWTLVGSDFEVVGLCYENEPKYTPAYTENEEKVVKNGYYIAEKNGLLGLIDMTGRWIAPAKYLSVAYGYNYWNVREGAYLLKEGRDSNVFAIYEDGRSGYEEEMFFWLGGASRIAFDETNGYFIYQFGQSYSVRLNHQFSGTHGVRKDVMVEDLTYTEDYFVPDEEADAYRDYRPADNVSLYAIATNGKLKSDFVFEDVRAFSDGLIAVKQNGKWGYANAEGKLVIPCAYRTIPGKLIDGDIPIPADCTEGYVVIYNGSEYALYNNQGREVIPFGAFEGLSEVQNGRLWAKQNGVWGILTLK